MINFVQGMDKLEDYKDAFINMANNDHFFVEPLPVKTTVSIEYDEIMCGPVKAIPEGFSVYDKVVI